MKDIIYNEVYAIISSMDPIFIEKIDKDYLSFIQSSMLDNISINIDENKSLNNQGFHDETFEILADINLQYWASEDLKKLLDKKYSLNEVKYND